MDFMNYIIENALILIPVLLAIGIGFSVAIIGFSVDAIIQGILVTGVTVLGNQLIKQSKKDE